MKIKRIRLLDFKRFTDLTITDLPATARLVVLIGPNGCGKSSLFDALHAKAVVQYHWGWRSEDEGYWNKQYGPDAARRERALQTAEKIDLQFHDAAPQDKETWKSAVYTRSAHRNDPSIQIEQIQHVGAAADEHRLRRLIDNDAAVTANYQRFVSNGLEDAFERGDEKTTLGEFRTLIMGDVKDAVHRLFDDPPLDLTSLSSPLRDPTFRFNKGQSKKFSYENLSGGEKAAFDLILDLTVKKRELKNTVFCIDEPEAHMGLRLQGRLLRELYQIIPANCQLWIATHSIGMMRAAYELEQENPGKVVFLDFGNKDFDGPVTITPSQIDRTVWQDMHEVVLDDLATLIAPNRIVLCEGKHGEDGLDAQCYNTIFARGFPDTLFVSTGGKGEGQYYSAVIKAIVKAEVVLLRDRDHLSDKKMDAERKTGKRVLSRAQIEDYLLDDEVLHNLCVKYSPNPELSFKDVLALKEQQSKSDIKACANKIRMWTIQSLGVQNAGDTRVSFLQDTLAPLIQPRMQVYQELRRDIFSAYP